MILYTWEEKILLIHLATPEAENFHGAILEYFIFFMNTAKNHATYFSLVFKPFRTCPKYANQSIRNLCCHIVKSSSTSR